MARYSVYHHILAQLSRDLQQGRITSTNLSSFNQQELVYKHKNLDDAKVKKLIQKAYIKYYFRPIIFWKILKEKLNK